MKLEAVLAAAQCRQWRVCWQAINGAASGRFRARRREGLYQYHPQFSELLPRLSQAGLIRSGGPVRPGTYAPGQI